MIWTTSDHVTHYMFKRNSTGGSKYNIKLSLILLSKSFEPTFQSSLLLLFVYLLHSNIYCSLIQCEIKL